jgi:D-arginine dehydrogenase
VRHIRRKWAGLRSFVRDRSPVVGYDPVQPGFFWLAGLGGFGIQTAPALSVLAAGLVLDREVEGALADLDFEPSALAPARL